MSRSAMFERGFFSCADGRPYVTKPIDTAIFLSILGDWLPGAPAAPSLASP